MQISDLFRKKSVEKIQRDAALGTSDAEARGLVKALGTFDLTMLGIAAIIGAGIFSTVGNAAFNGGPGVAFLFIFTAVACCFSALCYAEFAAMIPVAGSAYTYAYASAGELFAWIIGWDLLLEYAIGNIAVAISWSDYFTGLLRTYGVHIPEYLTMDFLTASRGLSDEAKLAWANAPSIGGLKLICDLPALLIVLLITTLVYVGIRESKRTANVLVALKIGVVVFVIVLGAFYVNPSNWSPFLPNGFSGVMKGVSAVFFAYIGFDAVSTTAEECRNPQRDLPRGMIYSLIVCTVLYVAISLILTGMVNYSKLQVGDPMAFVFGPRGANLVWVSRIIAASAVVAMATVLLVFQLGQPRIWMSMSRDGLLPPIFSAIHPTYRTPWFATIVAGLVVAIPSLFLNLTEVTDLTSIGTLFAFVLVSAGVLVLGRSDQKIERKFKVPYINAKFIAPALYAVIWIVALTAYREDTIKFFALADWETTRHKIPFLGFLVIATWLVVECFRKSHSLIPVLGVLSCGYLMTELGIINWIRFLAWLAIGLMVYFFYGFRHSKLGKEGSRQ